MGWQVTILGKVRVTNGLMKNLHSLPASQLRNRPFNEEDAKFVSHGYNYCYPLQKVILSAVWWVESCLPQLLMLESWSLGPWECELFSYLEMGSLWRWSKESEVIRVDAGPIWPFTCRDSWRKGVWRDTGRRWASTSHLLEQVLPPWLSEETNSTGTWHLDFELLSSRTQRQKYICCVRPLSMTLCYSYPRKFTQLGSGTNAFFFSWS